MAQSHTAGEQSLEDIIASVRKIVSTDPVMPPVPVPTQAQAPAPAPVRATPGQAAVNGLAGHPPKAEARAVGDVERRAQAALDRDIADLLDVKPRDVAGPGGQGNGQANSAPGPAHATVTAAPAAQPAAAPAVATASSGLPGLQRFNFLRSKPAAPSVDPARQPEMEPMALAVANQPAVVVQPHVPQPVVAEPARPAPALQPLAARLAAASPMPADVASPATTAFDEARSTSARDGQVDMAATGATASLVAAAQALSKAGPAVSTVTSAGIEAATPSPAAVAAPLAGSPAPVPRTPVSPKKAEPEPVPVTLPAAAVAMVAPSDPAVASDGPSPSPATSANTTGAEDVLAEMLRPMVRKWLDENMGRAIEKAVKAEVATQLAKTPKPNGSDQG